MNMIEYQDKATQFAKYPNHTPMAGLTYCTLGLTGEAGEVAEKVKKIIRDGHGSLTLEKAEDLCKELGDVLWYVSQTARELGFTLEQVAARNISKLTSRQERGVLGGSGDNR